jgi:hypothetical protein
MPSLKIIEYLYCNFLTTIKKLGVGSVVAYTANLDTKNNLEVIGVIPKGYVYTASFKNSQSFYICVSSKRNDRAVESTKKAWHF